MLTDSCQTVSEPDAVGRKSGGKRCEQSLPGVGGVLENGDASPVVSAGAPQGGRRSPGDLLSGLPRSPQASAVCGSRAAVNTLRQLVKMAVAEDRCPLSLSQHRQLLRRPKGRVLTTTVGHLAATFVLNYCAKQIMKLQFKEKHSIFKEPEFKAVVRETLLISLDIQQSSNCGFSSKHLTVNRSFHLLNLLKVQHK